MAPEGAQILIERRPQAYGVGSGNTHVFRVRQPQVWIAQMTGASFRTDREVVLPDPSLEVADQTTDRVTPLTLARAVLLHAAARPDHRTLVVGHTDTEGKKGHNSALSERRAENVRLFLAGDREGWAAHCQANHEVGDWQNVLKWLATTRGWPCDPGAVDNEFGPTSRAAREAFREHYNREYGGALEVEGPQSEADWRAINHVLDRALAELLGGDESLLASYRAGLRFLSPPILGCGEEWPIEAVGLDGYACAANRRVEVLFFEEASPPQVDLAPPGLDVYGRNRFILTPIPVSTVKGGRCLWVRLAGGVGADKEESFVLTSDDGSLQVSQSLRADGIPGSGFVDLCFTGLCAEGRYSLTCRGADGGETLIFAGVEYSGLAGLSPGAAPESGAEPDVAGESPREGEDP